MATANQSLNQPINQSINQPINQVINQVINQSIKQATKQQKKSTRNQSPGGGDFDEARSGDLEALRTRNRTSHTAQQHNSTLEQPFTQPPGRYRS